MPKECDPVCAGFRAKNFSVKDTKRSGRPLTVAMDEITTLIDANPSNGRRNPKSSRYVTWKRCSTPKDTGYVSGTDVWMHELIDRNLRLDA